jgi:hypothetical protein
VCITYSILYHMRDATHVALSCLASVKRDEVLHALQEERKERYIYIVWSIDAHTAAALSISLLLVVLVE